MNPAKIPAILPGKLPESKIIIVDDVDDENNDGEKDDDNIAVDVKEEVAAAAAAVAVADMVGVEAVIGTAVGIVGVATSSKTEIKIYERQLEKILYE